MKRRLFSLAALSAMLCTLFVAAGFISPRIVSASASTSDPWVVVAVDVTNAAGPCTETLSSKITSPHPSITRFPCPAGSIVKSEKIRRSEAIARHEAYVVLPAAQANLKLTQQSAQTKSQIFQLMEQKSSELRRSAQVRIPRGPAYTCGYSNFATLNWYVDNYGSYSSMITYYLSSDCSTVSLDQSSIAPANIYSNSWLYWDHDQYAAGSWDVSGHPYLYPGTTYYNYDGLDKHASGYYYENWTYDGFFFNYYYTNFGPLG